MKNDMIICFLSRRVLAVAIGCRRAQQTAAFPVFSAEKKII